MVLSPRSSSKERQPLLSRASTPQSIDTVAPSDDEHVPPPLNQFSPADLRWILAGLWSAVFLGALDGKPSTRPRVTISNGGSTTQAPSWLRY